MVSEAKSVDVYWDLNELSQIKDKKKATIAFEAYLFEQFLKEALKPEFKPLFGGDFQSSTYKDLFVMELSQEIAKEDPLSLERLMDRALHSYRSNS